MASVTTIHYWNEDWALSSLVSDVREGRQQLHAVICWVAERAQSRWLTSHDWVTPSKYNQRECDSMKAITWISSWKDHKAFKRGESCSTQKCRFMDKEVRAIMCFFVVPLCEFPLSVWCISRTSLPKNLHPLVLSGVGFWGRNCVRRARWRGRNRAVSGIKKRNFHALPVSEIYTSELSTALYNLGLIQKRSNFDWPYKLVVLYTHRQNWSNIGKLLRLHGLFSPFFSPFAK